jgi:methyl-accepting chemotaxis protein
MTASVAPASENGEYKDGAASPSLNVVASDLQPDDSNGWVSPQRVDEIIETIEMIAAGQYMSVPAETDKLSGALRGLSRSLGKHSSNNLRNMVSLSVNLNEGVSAAVEMARDMQEISHRSQNIASASEQLVASVEEIANNSSDIVQNADMVQEATRKGVAETGNAISAMQNIEQRVEVGTSRVDRLAGASEDISSILSIIEEIAFQTNLLALNASVEAARAGETGKGFAVVANEVKTLAGRTKDATVDIAKRVSTLKDEMSGIITTMKEISNVVCEGRRTIETAGEQMDIISTGANNVTRNIHEISTVLNEQKTATSDVANGITSIAGMTDHSNKQIDHTLDTMDTSGGIVVNALDGISEYELPNKLIHLAKSDHVIWKKRLAAMLLGREKLDSAELADHHGCRFGKWYDNIKDPKLTSHPAFQAIITPHAKVHSHGIRAVELFNSGDLNGAVGELQQVAHYSDEVLRLLNELAP